MTDSASVQQVGASAWASPLWLDLTDPLQEELYVQDDIRFDLYADDHALWVVASFPRGNRAAIRTAYSPAGGLELASRYQTDGGVQLSLRSPIGDYRVQISFPAKNRPLVRAVTWLRPRGTLRMPYWPPDVVVLGPQGKLEKSHGTIHTQQVGPRSGIVYASMDKPASGALLYMQNLTALNDYAIQTDTSLTDTVSGKWPEMGFQLPPTKEEGLPAGKELVLSDAFVHFSTDHPTNEVARARLYVDMLAEIYLCLPRPGTVYRPWPEMLEKSLQAIKTAPGVWSTFRGRRYLNAYLGDDYSPPESMVQLTVLLPLLEYLLWNPEAGDIANELLAGLKNFHDKKIGYYARFLPSAANRLKPNEPQNTADAMDSWYLYHPLLNLARLAAHGQKPARRMFFETLEYGIRVARHFNYRWPVFYDVQTLEVLRAETKPGAGGERDVPGIYLHVVMQAWDLSGDKRYLEEAIKAAHALEGNDFNLLYQSNDTLYGAIGLLRLWKATGDVRYLDLSTVSMANIFDQTWLWDCDYGYGRHFVNFFALLPLRDAPYPAAYEELECLGALTEYLAVGGKDLPASTRLLSAEYIRHLLSRANFYYPPELPAEMLAEKQEKGYINPDLWIPLEDLRAGWDKAGQVGQEVYGAGIAFGLLARHYFRPPDESFLVYIDYPVETVSFGEGSIAMRISGDERLDCTVRIIPVKGKPVPKVNLECGGENSPESIKAEKTDEGHQLFRLKGDCEVALYWAAPVKKRKSR